MTDGENGGSSVTRQTEYRFPGQNLGIVAETSYAEASLQRSPERTFAPLAVLVRGEPSSEPTRETPGDTGARSEDLGTISAGESSSSHLGLGQSPPQRPEEDAPDRPT